MAADYDRDDRICSDDPTLYDPNRFIRPERKWGLAYDGDLQVMTVALAGLNPNDEDQSFNVLVGPPVIEAIGAHSSAAHMVLDLRRVSMVSTGHPDWIQGTFGPTVGRLGIQRVAVLVPGNVYGFLVAGMPTPEGFWLNVKGARAAVPISYFDAPAPALAWVATAEKP
jgi:hypothetical protein